MEQLILGGLVGFVGGLFTSWRVFREYRQKKWWELKVEVYRNLIDSFSDLVHYYDVNYDAVICYQNRSGTNSEINKRFFDSCQKILRIINSGTFLLSDTAISALKEFANKETNFDPEYDDWVEYLEKNSVISRKCLETLIECSKNDLKVDSEFLCWLPTGWRKFFVRNP